MVSRPSFQFYPADWRTNSNLRRCSEAARGAWMDILCVLHDSDHYGVVRWPLAELARVAGVALKLAKELAEKLVLKGADRGPVVFTHTPRHAGKDGDPVTLVEGEGPIWFSSRMVKDEWRRGVSGGKTRFASDQQPSPSGTPTGSPSGRQGDDLGDGASTSSSTPSKKERSSLRDDAKRGKPRCQLPDNFPHEVDQVWARDHWLRKGRADLCEALPEEIEKFRDHHTGKATRSADWPGSWRTWARNAMNFNRPASNANSYPTAKIHKVVQ